jgi:hypothetical protein
MKHGCDKAISNLPDVVRPFINNVWFEARKRVAA